MFPQTMKIHVGEWHRMLAAEPCDMLKSMVIFLIIAHGFGNAYVQFYENSYLIFSRHQLCFWTFHDSFCKQICFFR